MTTGQIDSFAGTITDIGPMYPFVGTEVLMVIVGVAFWVIWHILQTKMENRIYEEDMQEYGDQLSMTNILKGEKLYMKLDDPKDLD